MLLDDINNTIAGYHTDLNWKDTENHYRTDGGAQVVKRSLASMKAWIQPLIPPKI
jgi:hypothetical protein